MNLPTSKPIPGWQIERANVLQRICRHIEIHEAKGKTLAKVFRIFAWRWNGKQLRKHPAHRLALHRVTLYRFYRHWQRNGQVPSAFYLKYKPGRLRFPARVLVRFIEFAANQDFNSLKEAWLAFCKRATNKGVGMIGGKPLVLHYSVVLWNLPSGFFTGIKRRRKAIQAAQRELSSIRLTAIAHIMSGEPRPSTKAKKSLNYEI